MQSSLPTHHRALVLESVPSSFELKHVPTPEPTHGSAVVRVVSAGILSYHREVYSGARAYPFPTPLVGGYSAIGRIAAIGPDATILRPTQLVYFECTIHARDDPDVVFLSAIHEGRQVGSVKLMREQWRDGAWASYVRVPLENCHVLDEMRLCHGLGYDVQQLMYIGYLLVPYGGLRDIGLEPGETVVVCPATGAFGGAGVQVAAAMGARVIAMGRNEAELARLKEHVLRGTPGACVETVKMTGDEAADTAALQAFGVVDAVLDVSPPAAMRSNHLRAAIDALRRGGRVSLMGFNMEVMGVKVMADNITLKGKLMYEREDIVRFLQMLERGLFPRGEGLVHVKAFALADWKAAMDMAAEYTGVGRIVAFSPESGD
jgi:threonine dehydrogenase-like Zn-dependent dehydrogenase